MIVMLFALLGAGLIGWLIYRFLLASPKIDRAADRTHLHGKTVWITGASGGIGEALTLYLKGLSSVKVVLSARNEKALEVVRQQLINSGVDSVMIVPLDLAALADDYAKAEAAVASVLKRFERVDVLVHNGGMSMRGDVASTKLEVDVQVMKTNHFGAVALTKAVLPSMLARRAGHIVAMSSMQGKLPVGLRCPYAASKHAMHAWFKGLQFEVADQSIGVTIVSPGYVRTQLSLNALSGDGTTYGKMDATQLKGYDPMYVAELSYAAVRQNVEEVVVADLLARVAVLLYTLFPTIFTKQMIKRTRKMRAEAGAQ